MNRTLKEIRAELDERAAQEPALQELNSPSQTRVFNVLADIFAFASWTLEQMFRYFLTILRDMLRIPAHNARWYQRQALKYQHGHELVWLEDQMRFDYIIQDLDAQIIAHSAATEVPGGVFIKVVKKSGDNLQPLTEEEYMGFNAYIDRVKDSGVRFTTRSWLPDDLFINYNIYYDPLVLSGSGKLLSDNSKEPVKEAIQTYIHNLPFNSTFRISKLEDVIQQVPGVVDLQKLSVKSRNGNLEFTEIEVSRIAEAGYMKITDDSVITYKSEYNV